MRLFLGTVVRASSVHRGGEIISLDWESGEVLKRAPVAPTNPDLAHDPNKRGNARGCRGIQVTDDEVVAADYHTIRIYDHELNLKRTMSDGLMVGLHETHLAERKLWVTSTTLDAVLSYDLETGERNEAYFPREVERLQRELATAPMAIDKSADCRARYLSPEHCNSPEHLHINAVTLDADGHTLALANRRGVIVDLTRNQLVVEDKALRGGHNLVEVQPGVFAANDSIGRTVRFYDMLKGRLLDAIDLTRFSEVRRILRRYYPSWSRRLLHRLGLGPDPMKIARPLFVRGLDVLDDELFVGVSPATVLRIDWRKKKLTGVVQIAHDPHVCIHGLRVLRKSA